MKGQKALAAQLEKDRASAAVSAAESRTAMKEKSPAELAREKENTAHNQWKAAKDYRTPPPGLINLNFGDPAQRQAQRELMLNTEGLGIMSMGAEGASSTALAAQKNFQRDAFDRDAAAQYEGDLRAEDSYQRDAASGLIQTDMARKSTMYSGDNQSQQFFTNMRAQYQPQSILPSLLTGGLAAAGAFLGNPAAMGSLMGGGAAGKSGANH